MKFAIKMGYTASILLALTSVFIPFLALPHTISADSGIIPIADAIVYEPGQKAIIGWDGEYEVLILSTDVHADQNTVALQILPLPSEPESIEEGSFDSFLRISELIHNRFSNRGSWFDCGPIKESGDEKVEIVFHEKIGAHDIYVAKATDTAEFIRWAEDFLTANEIQHKISSSQLKSVVAKYIEEGINFFVFDLLELSPAPRSIEPIIYRFQSDTLYFPLKISSIVSGDTSITLFLVTHGFLTDLSQLPVGPTTSVLVSKNIGGKVVEIENLVRSGMSVAHQNERPIQFKLERGELESIDGRLAELLGGDAWLTALVSDDAGGSYASFAIPIPVESLGEDLKIAETSFTDESVGGMSGWIWIIVGIFGGIIALVVLAFMLRRHLHLPALNQTRS